MSCHFETDVLCFSETRQYSILRALVFIYLHFTTMISKLNKLRSLANVNRCLTFSLNVPHLFIRSFFTLWNTLFTLCPQQVAQQAPFGPRRSEERLSELDHLKCRRRRIRHQHLLQLLQRGFLHQLLAEGLSWLLKNLLFILSWVHGLYPKPDWLSFVFLCENEMKHVTKIHTYISAEYH